MTTLETIRADIEQTADEEQEHDKKWAMGLRYAVKIIDKYAEQEPKTGEWINKEFRKEEYILTGKCSKCGKVRVIDEFCSNCGTSMISPENIRVERLLAIQMGETPG